MQKRKIFNDPIHGFITIPHPLIFEIIEHPWFQRLRRIKQLGLTDYVYPGAIHTRFHHGLGAFHLMRKALAILKVKGCKITDEEELAASIAILLHDIGHGPFSHTLEASLIPGVHHEDISKIYLRELNKQFNGKLSLAIEIFEGTYKKKFLHQLVSSQLDVDRLDYLIRDSFFTGVGEGAIPYERIIEMMNVANDEIVIEQKGIYSIESFIIARRLMYWQVYLHKTVMCIEQMAVKAIERARYLIKQGVELPGPSTLLVFLTCKVGLKDFEREILETYSELDDVDIFAAFKAWQHTDDKILSLLSHSILYRKLFKIDISDEPFSAAKIKRLTEEAERVYKLPVADLKYLVFTDTITNHAYQAEENKIHIIKSNGQVLDIAKVSTQLNMVSLSEPVTKYFLFYPKNIKI